jgi:pimeloyl-ACP methyl ester carboxylesterase
MICYPMAVGPVITRVFEAGDVGPPVLLIHGYTSRADRFRATAQAIAARGYRVFVPDLPGHGFATKDPRQDHTIGGYRDFVLGLMDALGLERAALIGTSLGGHVVGAVACQCPERISALTMIGSLGMAPLPPERAQAIKAGLADMTPAGMRNRLLRVFCDPRFVTDELVQEDVKINTSPGAVASLTMFADYLTTRFNQDLVLDGLGALGGRFPFLLLWGDQDASVPVEVGRAARAALPAARLAIFHGVNHTPYIERPDLFEPVIFDLLGGRLGCFAAPDVTWI